MSGWEGKMRSTNALCLKHRQSWLLPALHLQKEKKNKEKPQNCAWFLDRNAAPPSGYFQGGFEGGLSFHFPTRSPSSD